jgi:hypothetical protein
MTFYNQAVIDAAALVAQQVQKAFLDIAEEGAATLSAIAGAGKSRLATNTVGKCRNHGFRVAVTAPTNEQVFALVHSIGKTYPKAKIVFLPASTVDLPGWARLPNVEIIDKAKDANNKDIVIATVDKFASARNPRNPKQVAPIDPFDAVIIDESYQVSAAKYYAVASIAPRHLCVGDGGQILPFTRYQQGWQWKGLAEDPLKSATAVLQANRPDTQHFQFPITRRLDPRGAAIARHFYPPDHNFGAAVLDGVRSMKLKPSKAAAMYDRAIDKGLDYAATTGWAYFEQPAMQTLVADPDTAELIKDILMRLHQRADKLTCELHPLGTPLMQSRVAVAVSHHQQLDLVRYLLDRNGLQQVVVNTANKLQGLEFDVLVCWHPLAGLMEADQFHVESGRLCVMCTRHRHACIVVGRQGDRDLVEGVPPSTPTYPGAGSGTDDILRGWETHRNVFAELESSRIAVK